MSDEEWAGKCLSDDPGGTAAEWAPKPSFRYISGAYDDPDPYRRLRDVLADCDRTLGTAAATSSTWLRRHGCSGSSRSSWVAAG